LLGKNNNNHENKKETNNICNIKLILYFLIKEYNCYHHWTTKYSYKSTISFYFSISGID